MAIGDIKILSLQPADVDTSVGVEATARIEGDNVLKTDITNNVRGIEIDDTVNDTKAQLIENQIPALRDALDSAIAGRKQMYGDPSVEVIDGGVGFASKFDTINTRTATSLEDVYAASSDQSTVEEDAINTETKLSGLESTVNDILNNVDNTFDNVKEAFDYITQMDLDDDTLISGFTTTRNAELDILLDDALFNNTVGFIYKDKNSDTYYRMYITGGNLITEEVNAPA